MAAEPGEVTGAQGGARQRVRGLRRRARAGPGARRHRRRPRRVAAARADRCHPGRRPTARPGVHRGHADERRPGDGHRVQPDPRRVDDRGRRRLPRAGGVHRPVRRAALAGSAGPHRRSTPTGSWSPGPASTSTPLRRAGDESQREYRRDVLGRSGDQPAQPTQVSTWAQHRRGPGPHRRQRGAQLRLRRPARSAAPRSRCSRSVSRCWPGHGRAGRCCPGCGPWACPRGRAGGCWSSSWSRRSAVAVLAGGLVGVAAARRAAARAGPGRASPAGSPPAPTLDPRAGRRRSLALVAGSACGGRSCVENVINRRLRLGDVPAARRGDDMTATAIRRPTSRSCSGGRPSGPPPGPAARTGCAGTSSATAWCGSSRPRASRWSPCRGSTWSSTAASCSPSSAPPAPASRPLLNILSGLDVPTAGIARVAGYDLLTMSAATAAALPPAHGRLRLAADRPQPAAVPDRAGERRAADAAGRRRAPAAAAPRRASCWTWSGSATAPTAVRTR